MTAALTDTSITMPTDREVVITRTFDAPREMVYQTYTNRHAIPRWWGPSNLTTTVEKMEVRKGGTWRFVQRAPDGTVHAFHGEFLEVTPPSLLVMTLEYEGAKGSVVTQRITFEETKGRTTLTTVATFNTKAERDGMVASGMESGMRESMDRVATELVDRRPIMIRRTFDAPVALVFRMWSDCEQLKKWWGPKPFTASTCKMDFRVGGAFFWGMRSPDGQEFGMAGTFLEIVANQRISLTTYPADSDGKRLVSSGFPSGSDPEGITTITFEKDGAKTLLTLYDGGMPVGEETEQAGAGWRSSFDKLAEAL